MSLKPLFRKRSLFLTFFISYLAILVITIALGSISYWSSAKVISEEMESYNMAMLQQAQQVLDERLRSIEQLALEVSINPRIQKFLYKNSDSDDMDLYELSKVQEDISNYSKVNNLVDTMFVYFNGLDTVISDSAKYKPELFYEKVVPYSGWKYEQWLEILNSNSFKEYMQNQSIALNSEKKNVITFINSLPYGTRVQPLGALSILLKEDQIENLLKGINILDKGTVYILDSKDQIITSIGDKKLVKHFSFNSLNDNSFFYDKINRNEVMVSYVGSKNSDWKYISVIPTSAFSGSMNFVKLLTIIIIILELLTGTILALLLARKNYLPIKRSIERLKEKAKGLETVGNVTNQIDFIEEVTSITIRENQKIKETVNQMQPVYYTNLLVQLIKGFLKGNSNTESLLASVGVYFNFKYFYIILINIDDCIAFIKDDSIKEYGLVKLVINNIFSELFGQQNTVYAIDIEWNMLALIVNTGDVSGDGGENFISLAHVGQEAVARHFSILISIGIGNIYEGFEGINHSYQEASKALEYKLIKGTGSIITFEDIHNVQQKYTYPFETELKLANSVKSGDFESVCRLLDEVYDKNFMGARQSLEAARCLVFDMISTTVKVVNDLSIDMNKAYEGEFVPFEKLTACKTVAEMYTVLKEVYRTLCSHINKNKKSHNVELRDQILDFIEKNYGDYNFSLSAIANTFNLNNTYLSYFFKEQVGENFVSYLNKMRIEKAKELLRESELSLDNISLKVGYANSRVLIRIFKKFEGITPGKYRENHAKQSEAV